MLFPSREAKEYNSWYCTLLYQSDCTYSSQLFLRVDVFNAGCRCLSLENLNAHLDQIFASLTAQKMKFSIKDFFSKCDQIRKNGHIYWRNP